MSVKKTFLQNWVPHQQIKISEVASDIMINQCLHGLSVPRRTGTGDQHRPGASWTSRLKHYVIITNKGARNVNLQHILNFQKKSSGMWQSLW